MLKRILVADVGSTFTSVSLLEATSDGIHIIDSSASPTTVSGNGLDVMVGVKNAVEKLEERTGITVVSADGLLSPSNGNSGVDCFVSTCSAGGGLKVLAAGLSDQITVELSLIHIYVGRSCIHGSTRDNHRCICRKISYSIPRTRIGAAKQRLHSLYSYWSANLDRGSILACKTDKEC